MIVVNFHWIGKKEIQRIALTMCMRCIMALLGSLGAISAVIKSWPGDLPYENFCMNDLISFGVNGLGERVIESGLSRKLCILFSIDGMVRLFVLKTSERCCLKVFVLFVVYCKLGSGFFNEKVIVLIF